MGLINCPDCKKQISSNCESCIHCGCVISKTPRCPTCRSSNVHKISAASKIGSAVMIGIFALGKIGKTYQCNDCKCRW